MRPMSFLRYSLTLVALLALAAGYAASQYAFFNGRASEYAQTVDTPAIRILALVFLLAAIAFSFVPDKEEPQA